MKKLFLLLSVVFVVFTSCSSDDSADSDAELTTNGYLVKRIIRTNSSGGVIIYDNFYVGNKITKQTSSNGGMTEYTYVGDLITKSDYFVNNVLQYSDYFQYNTQQQLTNHKVLNFINNTAFKTDLIYNNDNTVNVNSYTGDFNIQNTLSSQKKIFLLPNGDVEKIENYVVVNGVNNTRTTTYTYDTKNAVANSILGMNKLKLWDGINTANSHNVIFEVYTTTENSSSVSATTNLTYNSYDFPITSTFNGGASTLITTQYFYQQP